MRRRTHLEQKLDGLIKNFMIFFLILMVSAAGFCGFFAKWAFRDGSSAWGFDAYMEGTGHRPGMYRQLLPQTVKLITSAIPEQTKEKLQAKLVKDASIEKRYAQAHITRKYIIEYYLMYIICIVFYISAIYVLRSLLSEILQDQVAGTLGALFFALVFPFFEVLGGYFYDIGEILFLFMAARFALHGNWAGLLILTPIAEANKEAFLFFIPSLYPLLRQHFDTKKCAGITLLAMFFAGVVYLYIRQAFAGNPGGMVEHHALDHLSMMFNPLNYFKTSSIYGLPLGSGMFLPHMICVAWIVKNAWRHFSDPWKLHAKIALVINGILYFFFVVPDEIRDLSLLYVSFMALTAFYIRDLIRQNMKI